MRDFYTSRLKLAFALIALSAFISCKKDGEPSSPETPPAYYLRFKVNGAQQDYTLNYAMSYGSASDNYTMGVSGMPIYTTDTPYASAIGVTFLSASPFVNNTSFSEPYSPSGAPGLILNYVSDTVTYNNLSYILGYGKTNGTIDEVTPLHIKGTFSGEIYDTTQADIKFNITDGEYFVKIL